MTKFQSKKNDSYKSESTNEEPVQESNSKPVEEVNNTSENTDKPIDWKRFDHIYCINYYKNNDRLNHIMSEFHRLSITDNFSVERIYPSVLDVDNYNVDKDKFPNIDLYRKAKAHFNCIEKALYENYERILIVEDDASFMNDKKMVFDLIDDLPINQDIVMFDNCLVNYADSAKEMPMVSKYYADMDDVRMCLSTCYSLSRKGMEHVYYNQKNKFMVPDYYLSKQSGVKDIDKLKRCICDCRMVVQSPNFTKESISSELMGDDKNPIIKMYKNERVNMNNYNI